MTRAMCRDEDHLALFIELLGRMPRRVWGTGNLRASRQVCAHCGALLQWLPSCAACR